MGLELFLFFEQVVQSNTADAFLVFLVTAKYSMGLARTGNSIGQNSIVEAIKNALDLIRNRVLKNELRSLLLTIDMGE